MTKTREILVDWKIGEEEQQDWWMGNFRNWISSQATSLYQ